MNKTRTLTTRNHSNKLLLTTHYVPNPQIHVLCMLLHLKSLMRELVVCIFIGRKGDEINKLLTAESLELSYELAS